MYDYNKNLVDPSINKEELEENFSRLTEAFERTVLPLSEIESQEKDYDFNKVYRVGYACAWNSPKSIGREVIMLERNDKIAHVCFNGGNEPKGTKILNRVFRLEDLVEVSS